MKNRIKLFLLLACLAAAGSGTAQPPVRPDGTVDIEKLIVDNTPAALPQSPKLAISDAADLGYKGKVKSVRYFFTDDAERGYSE